MGATVIDGKACAARLRADLAREVGAFTARRGQPPGLRVVLVGESPASASYVRTKARMAAEVGIASEVIQCAADLGERDLLRQIQGLNADPAVHGILVQLPLPPQIDPERVQGAIQPAKDVDGFHPLNVGRLFAARARLPEGLLVPCTPAGCMILLQGVLGDDLAGRHAVVLGRSNIVGKPMAALLLAADCTVTIAHSRTRDLPELCRRAEILIAAVGRPEMVRANWIRPGAVVIDVGINRTADASGRSRLVGDVAFAEALGVAGAITPVPGGVGPMTVACLLQNTLRAAQSQEAERR